LSLANRFWRNSYDRVDSSTFHFGNSYWSRTENVGYFINDAGIVQSFRENGEIVGQWNSFEQFLEEEIPRVERVFSVEEDRRRKLRMANEGRKSEPARIDPHEELQLYIKRYIASGFMDLDQIVEVAVDIMQSEYKNVEGLDKTAQDLAVKLLQVHLREQQSWPEVTDFDLLESAFNRLSESGILAKHNAECCQTCATGQVLALVKDALKEGKQIRGYTFYHEQDTESAIDSGILYISYGSVEGGDDASINIGKEVAAALLQIGLKVDWDEIINKRIAVPFNWRRRWPYAETFKSQSKKPWWKLW
jgi:hypothetical protein